MRKPCEVQMVGGPSYYDEEQEIHDERGMRSVALYSEGKIVAGRGPRSLEQMMEDSTLKFTELNTKLTSLTIKLEQCSCISTELKELNNKVGRLEARLNTRNPPRNNYGGQPRGRYQRL